MLSPVRRTREGAPASANAHEQGAKCSTKKSRTPAISRRRTARNARAMPSEVNLLKRLQWLDFDVTVTNQRVA